MQHPEIGELSDRTIIGFNPVYGTHQPPTKSSPTNSPVMWGACLAVALICVATSGGLLWTKAQKSQSEIDAQVQKALVIERSRAIECINHNQATTK